MRSRAPIAFRPVPAMRRRRQRRPEAPTLTTSLNKTTIIIGGLLLTLKSVSSCLHMFSLSRLFPALVPAWRRSRTKRFARRPAVPASTVPLVPPCSLHHPLQLIWGRLEGALSTSNTWDVRWFAESILHVPLVLLAQATSAPSARKAASCRPSVVQGVYV